MAPSATVENGERAVVLSVSVTSGRALEDLSDAIEEVHLLKTPPPSSSGVDLKKDKAEFRRFDAACARVRAFYSEQHTKQTVAYNRLVRERFHSPERRRTAMTVWAAMERLNTLLDDSDPDTELSQIQHLLQSAEAMRRDGQPRWMQVTGLVHDLGKLLYFLRGDGDSDSDVDQLSQGQWDVVGDTFPVGCAFDRAAIVLSDSFAGNPDAADPLYSTRCGMYAAGCGLDNVMLSWGHDEYLYLVLRDQSRLPAESLAMIRYHSLYPWHTEGAYRHLMSDKDEALLAAVQAFNPYDLYSKGDAVPDVEALKPYYLELIDEFFPQKVLLW